MRKFSQKPACVLLVLVLAALASADNAPLRVVITGRGDRDENLIGRWLPLEREFGVEVIPIAAGRSPGMRASGTKIY